MTCSHPSRSGVGWPGAPGFAPQPDRRRLRCPLAPLLLCPRDAHLDIDGQFPEMRGQQGSAAAWDTRLRFRRFRTPLAAHSGTVVGKGPDARRRPKAGPRRIAGVGRKQKPDQRFWSSRDCRYFVAAAVLSGEPKSRTVCWGRHARSAARRGDRTRSEVGTPPDVFGSGLLVGSELIQQGACLLCTGAVALGQEQVERCACLPDRRVWALECG